MKKTIRQTLPAILMIIGLAFASCNTGNQESKNGDEKKDTLEQHGTTTANDVVDQNRDSQGILLRFNPKLGDTILTKTVIEQSITVMGQKGTNNMSMTMSMTATNKTDSLVTIQSRIEEMSLNSDILGQSYSFDSKLIEDVDPELAAPVKDMLEQTFEVVFDIYGNPVIVPEDYPQEQGITAVFPKEMVYVGSQWTRDAENAINGITTHMVGTYTVKKITEKTTEIEFSGTVTAETIKGDATGIMTIDNETGIPITANMVMPMSMTGDIPMTINQTITMTTE